MKTKQEINNGFGKWIDDEAVLHGWSLTQKGEMRSEMMKEVDWSIRSMNSESDIIARNTKYQNLIIASETGDISSYDPYWKIRMEIWAWMRS